MNKKLKVEFAPGCFDSFEGTQEELDALMKEINESIQSGDFLEKSNAVDLDELELEDPELAQQLREMLNNLDLDDLSNDKRKLN